MGTFCLENLVKADDMRPMRVDHMCEHNKLDADYKNELKAFKHIYKLMEKDVDISEF